ncbi:MAG: hypothetical protein ACRDIB_03255, partial [Ardenticatenaceae bacterium]
AWISGDGRAAPDANLVTFSFGVSPSQADDEARIVTPGDVVEVAGPVRETAYLMALRTPGGKSLASVEMYAYQPGLQELEELWGLMKAELGRLGFIPPSQISQEWEFSGSPQDFAAAANTVRDRRPDLTLGDSRLFTDGRVRVNFHSQAPFHQGWAIAQSLPTGTVVTVYVMKAPARPYLFPIWDTITQELQRQGWSIEPLAETRESPTAEAAHATNRPDGPGSAPATGMTGEGQPNALEVISNTGAMKEYYQDYSQETALTIWQAIPKAYEKRNYDMGRWGPAYLKEIVCFNPTTIGRYVSAFRKAGITHCGDIPLW